MRSRDDLASRGADFLFDTMHEVGGRESIRHGDRVAHRLGGRSPMTDDDQSGDTNQRRAAVLRVVEPATEPPECTAGQEVPDLTRKRPTQLVAEQRLDRLDETFAG